ncbi:MAG: V-type ATPase subunit [Promethearchaeati archaeon SRVP18_Atabeyarchaeia-1]
MYIGMPRKYAYLNAKIRALISKMLSAGDYEKILQSDTFEESARLLSTTVTGGELVEALTRPQVDLFEVDQALSNIYAKSFKMICEYAPKQARLFLATYYSKIDVDALKTIIRAVHSGIPKDEALRYVITTSEKKRNEYSKLSESQSVAQLVEEVQDRVLRQAAINALPLYESTHSSVPLEASLDRTLYSLLWEQIIKLRSIDRTHAKSLVGARIDLTNMLIALRSRELNFGPSVLELVTIPVSYKLKLSMDDIAKTRTAGELLNIFSGTAYREVAQQARELFEKEPDLTQIESLADRYIAHQSFREFAGYSFHVGIALAYLNLKFYELRNIKASIIGKYEKIPAQRIRNVLIFF